MPDLIPLGTGRNVGRWRAPRVRLDEIRELRHRLPAVVGVVGILRIVKSDRLEVPTERPVEVTEEPYRDRVVVVVRRRDELSLNSPASEFVPPETETLAEASPALAAALDAGEGVTVLDADGDERVFDLSVSPIRTRDGRSRGDLLVLRDITLRRRRERELERQNDRLDGFANVVSHDLRNPLNVAIGRLELARRECDSDHLKEAENAIDRMETLVDDLLTLAREGKAVGDVEPVNLTTLAEAYWSTVATGNGVLRVESDLTVRADRSRLRQLLENLFRNAVEHGSTGSRSGSHGNSVEHGGATVRVGALPEGRGFYVTDDEPGIPEAERDQVFESGYSTATDGTGFGLAIVAEIVEAHGWEVSVTDGQGGGARFEVVTADGAASDGP